MHDGLGKLRAIAACVLSLLVTACGRSAVGPSPTTTTTTTSTTSAYVVQSVTDGDTIRITPSLLGGSSVRLLNIDAPEIGGATQEPWASESRDNLRALLATGTMVTLALDREQLDTFGRLLAHVSRQADSLNVNREQVRLGHAVTYTLWPNVANFEDYRAAQIEAQGQGRGVWNPARPLAQLPFEYRLGTDRPTRPAADFFSRFYVDGSSYAQVHANNRVFFANEAEALGAGYRACPRDGVGYSPFCFASGQ